MRSVIIVFGVFLVMLILIGFNSIYVCRASESLSTAVSELPPPQSGECTDALARLRADWSSKKWAFGLSAKLACIDRIEEGLAALEIHAAHGDAAAFELARELLRMRFSELGRFERIRL